MRLYKLEIWEGTVEDGWFLLGGYAGPEMDVILTTLADRRLKDMEDLK